VADLRSPITAPGAHANDVPDDWEEPEPWDDGIVAPDPWAESAEPAGPDTDGGYPVWEDES
jgi:hypothetical protein